ncbi:MAG: DNA polymerase III subunit gamma/tau [Coriobacteriia bacterium]
MAHQSWYRTYRPQTFDDVVGQTHIERTLRNAVDEDSVAHAYLFTGPRGTGKTTTARILAKALNCEKGPSGQPDDTCDDCHAIAEGRHPDVYELDAASRTGVDAVREEIIGRVNYAPTRGRWKVYIIDEVHMLSNAAFNALLKTLEEPPPHTVFVLCTTHPHKVPETIHSRCQRFDFHRLSVEEIAQRLRHIAEHEKVAVADGALSLIARHALGGMRDAITTLEQLASFSGGDITLEDVEGLLGEVDADVLFDAADIILERDVAGAFRFVAELAEQGVDMTEFIKAFVRHARDLFVVAAVPEAGEAVDVTSGDRTRLESQSRAFGLQRIARMLDVLDRLSTELRYAADQRLAVEVALTRIARPESDLTLEALAERIESLEAGQIARGASSPTPKLSSTPPTAAPAIKPAEQAGGLARAANGPVARPVAPEPDASAAPGESAVATNDTIAVSAGPLDGVSARRSWPAVVAEFKKLKPSRSHLFDSTELEVSGDTLVIEFPKDQAFALDLARNPDTLQILRRSIGAVLGVQPPVEFRLGRQGSSAPAPRSAAAPTSASAPTPGPATGSEAVVSPELQSSASASAPASSPAPASDDVEMRLISDLGAVVVDEREHGSNE